MTYLILILFALYCFLVYGAMEAATESDPPVTWFGWFVAYIVSFILFVPAVVSFIGYRLVRGHIEIVP